VIATAALCFGGTGSFAQAADSPCGYDVGNGFLTDSNAKMRAADEALSKRFPGAVAVTVSPMQRVLSLTLKSGQQVQYKNIPCDSSPHHTVLEYLQRQGYFIVHVSEWEDAELILVRDTTGKQYRLAQSSGRIEAPILSPDGQRLVVISNDFYVESSRIQLWELAASGPKLLWSYSPVRWFPAQATWVNAEAVEVKVVYWQNQQRRESFLLSARRSGRWSIGKPTQ
jgi:hypothetical protein